MFYCEPCGTERAWPVDVPSAHLPPPKPVESGAPKERP